MKLLTAALLALILGFFSVDLNSAWGGPLPAGNGNNSGWGGYGGYGGYGNNSGHNKSDQPNQQSAKNSKDNNDDNNNHPVQNQVTPTTHPVVNDEVAKAAAAMNAAEHKAKSAFETSDPWTSAQTDLDKARADLATARNAAVKSLSGNATYQQAVASSKKAEADRDALRSSGSATPDQMTSAATAVLNARTAVTKAEGDACNADSAVVAANATVAQATSAMADVRQKEQAAVEADPEWQAAKQQLDDAKSKVANAVK